MIIRHDEHLGSTGTRVAFVSDLHLFSSRCNEPQHRDAIDGAIRWCDVCIWGGDLFDLRWADRPPATAHDDAIEYLSAWTTRYASKRYVYLWGNHDVEPEFRDRLSRWMRSQQAYEPAADVLRIANTVFLHGDVIEGSGSPESFARYRGRWSAKSPAGRWRHRLYDVAVAGRLHLTTSAIAHRHRRTASRLIRWCDRYAGGRPKRIVFGHTHRKIDGVEIDGVRIHNGGAAVRHVRFAPVQIAL